MRDFYHRGRIHTPVRSHVTVPLVLECVYFSVFFLGLRQLFPHKQIICLILKFCLIVKNNIRPKAYLLTTTQMI